MIALAAGCGPTIFIVWSPDGTRAVVLGDDGLHLCDLNGKLTGSLAPKAECVAWLPDGKRIVVATEDVLRAWDEISKAFPKEAAAAAGNMDAVRSELLAAGGDWKKFTEAVSGTLHLSDGQLAMTLIDLRDHEKAALEAKLNDDMRKNLESELVSVDNVEVYLVGDGVLNAGPELLSQLRDSGSGVDDLRVSSMGTAVTVTVDAKDEPPKLLVLATDGSGRSCDLGRAAGFPDWSPDGRTVVFERPYDWHKDNTGGALLGMVTRSQVIDDHGALLDTDHLPKADDLAGMLFDPAGRVRVAKDGRISFVTTEITLPTTMQDVAPQKTIFLYDPQRPATLVRVIPRGAEQTLGDAAQYFELSPDARYISIPFGDGRVSVLDTTATDNVAIIVQEKPDEQQTIPTWRTATELTFVRPTADGKGHEIVRYSMTDKSVTVLSAGWPQSVLGALYKAPATQPATQPAK